MTLSAGVSIRVPAPAASALVPETLSATGVEHALPFCAQAKRSDVSVFCDCAV
jgi:hypothetical protein